MFFAALLVHELAHSLTARRYGMEVSSITLYVFGGVSLIKKIRAVPATNSGFPSSAPWPAC